jgi:hypothetical protein
MDEIVEAASRKWPHVPHRYGWLSLDACFSTPTWVLSSCVRSIRVTPPAPSKRARASPPK